jgi:hypothetical protein
MNASDLTVGAVCLLELWPSGESHFPVSLQTGMELVLAETEGVGPTVRLQGTTVFVKGADAGTDRRLSEVIERGLARVVWVVRVHGEASGARAVLVQVHEFASGLQSPEELALHIDDELLDICRARFGVDGVTAAERLIRDSVVLPPHAPGGLERIIVSAGVGTSIDRGFRIVGCGHVVDVLRRRVESASGVGSAYFIRRVSRPSRSSPTSTLALVSARVTVVDASRTAARAQVRGELDMLVQTADSYLKLWREYNELERKRIQLAALDCGSVRYTSFSTRADGGIRFLGVAASSDVRERLESLREEEADVQATEEPVDPEEGPPHGPTFCGTLTAAGSGWVEVRPRLGGRASPPDGGYLSVSTFGDERRLDRRKRAAELITTGNCRIPWLGKILEGSSHPVVQRKRVEPLSEAALQAFGGKPTPAQVDALDAALNTPDIAIIQGPPGTGKTRVIAALQARLAELGEGEGGRLGQTLLTSYQHDAVDNVASASTAFGLPAFRIGGRSGEGDTDNAVERWRRELIEKLRASIASQPCAPVQVVRRRLRDRLSAVSLAPLTEDANAALLEEVRSECGTWLNAEVAERLDKTLRSLRTPAASAELSIDMEQAIAAVSGLPTTLESAKDDGARRAKKALRLLRPLGVLDDIAGEVLERMAEWNGDGEAPALSMMPDLRLSLLVKLRPAARVDDLARPNIGVEGVLTDVLGLLDAAARVTALDASVAVEDLIDDLESDPDGVRADIQQYASSLAATVQQSVGGSMQRVKLSDVTFGDKAWPSFRNVIVDEAARCNPLDLMIPLSIAEKRIVLVGDHRQLPQVLEPDVERELIANANEATRRALTSSLFERLREHLERLEAKDGVRRYVRLDRQYRMHPVLGQFVSDGFYGRYSEGFESPRPASDFEHALGGHYEGVVAAWKDVPHSEGGEVGGRSKRRPPEASWIAEEVHRIGAENKGLSIGVITFYSAQVRELCEALQGQGILEEEEGGWRPVDEWRFTSTGSIRNRIRVGTVDSFQGMEFDVVFLSLVRSNRVQAGAGTWHKKYGFLLLDNRLCVAMSRQQRLLIVVGDCGMFSAPHLADIPGVRALLDYWHLTGGEHGRRL